MKGTQTAGDAKLKAGSTGNKQSGGSTSSTPKAQTQPQAAQPQLPPALRGAQKPTQAKPNASSQSRLRKVESSYSVNSVNSRPLESPKVSLPKNGSSLGTTKQNKSAIQESKPSPKPQTKAEAPTIAKAAQPKAELIKKPSEDTHSPPKTKELQQPKQASPSQPGTRSPDRDSNRQTEVKPQGGSRPTQPQPNQAPSRSEQTPIATARASKQDPSSLKTQDVIIMDVDRELTSKAQETPYLSESQEARLSTPRTPTDLDAQIAMLEAIVSKRIPSETELRNLHLDTRSHIKTTFRNLKAAVEQAEKTLLDLVNSQQDKFIDDMRFHMSQLEALLARARTSSNSNHILNQTAMPTPNSSNGFSSQIPSEIGISSIVG